MMECRTPTNDAALPGPCNPPGRAAATPGRYSPPPTWPTHLPRRAPPARKVGVDARALGQAHRLAVEVRALPAEVPAVDLDQRLFLAVGQGRGHLDRLAQVVHVRRDLDHVHVVRQLHPDVAPVVRVAGGDADVCFAGIDFTHRLDLSHPLKRLYHGGFATGGIAIGDLDGDGLPDVYFVSGPARNQLYRNLGGLRFEIVTGSGLDGGDRWGTGAAMADIDNDGVLNGVDLDSASPTVCEDDGPSPTRNRSKTDNITNTHARSRRLSLRPPCQFHKHAPRYRKNSSEGKSP